MITEGQNKIFIVWKIISQKLSKVTLSQGENLNISNIWKGGWCFTCDALNQRSDYPHPC